MPKDKLDISLDGYKSQRIEIVVKDNNHHL